VVTDPLRESLTAAIADATEAERAVAAARGAVARAKQLVTDATREVDSAKARLAEARAAHAQRATEAATGGGVPARDRGTAEAREAVADAEEGLSAARAALATVEAAVPAAEAAARDAKKCVAESGDAIIKAAARELLERAMAAQAELIRDRVVLRWMMRENLVATADQQAARRLLSVTSFPAASGCVEFEDWNAHPAADAWRAVRESLRRDPEATLPTK
jgi:hypothetical protein